MTPLDDKSTKSARVQRVVKFRPITKKGLEKMTDWLIDEKWESVYSPKSAHDKAENFQTLLLQKYHLFFPETTQKFTSEDQPVQN